MVNTFYDSYRILMHVYSEGSFLKQAINSEIIEPINRNAVVKICYGVVERDIELEYYIKKLCEKRPKLPVRVLLKIALYNIKHLEKAPYAVTNSAVELLKKLGKGGMSGFLNAILRKYIKIAPIQLPKNNISKLSIKYCFPEFVVKELIENYGLNEAEKIMEFNEISNYLRFNKNINGKEYLENLKVNFENTPFENVFKVKNFAMEDGFYKGDYTFQSIGSVAICNIVESGENLLDCCSAPGGKSVYLSDKFKEIVAGELHEHRCQLINSYIERMGAKNIIVKQMDATIFNEDFKDKFDSVLCDSPCSGLGVTLSNPDIKLNRSLTDVFDLNKIQLKIINNVSKYVKKGGFLYYSTCSILKRENDGIISEFLKNNKDFEVVEINSPLKNKKTEFGLQFLPYLSMGAGFYICKLKKL